MKYVHIVDKSTKNRAELARAMLSNDFHAEIYEDSAELVGHNPRDGIVLAEEEQAAAIVQAIKGGAWDLPLVIYARCPSTEKAVAAMRAGALDYLEWPISLEKLNACLRRAEREDEHVIAKARKRGSARQLIAKLSARELDVLRLLVDGGSNKSIANQLGISDRTVEIHRGNLMNKLQARSVADVVRIALYSQVVEAFEDAA